MRAILEVVEGPLSGRRIELLPGQPVSFGRTTKSDISIPGDGYMSGRHFQVENTGDLCQVRDLGSSNGTFVNGNRAAEQPLNPQDLIAAGSSKFRFIIEEALPAQDFSRTSTIPAPNIFEATIAPQPPSAPPPPPPPLPPPMPAPVAAPPPLPPPLPPPMPPPPPPPPPDPWAQFVGRERRILDTLFAGGVPVYAIVDPTKDMLVRAFVEACGEPVVALTETLTGTRPGAGSYLVAVPRNSTKLLEFLAKDAWGKNWGVYCNSQAGLDAVTNHLRNTINVYTAASVPFQLRLFDAQLLRCFLPGLQPHEATGLMGPIDRFHCEASGGRELHTYTLAPHGIVADVRKLDTEETRTA